MALFSELAIEFIVVCALALLYFLQKYKSLAGKHLNMPSDTPSMDNCRWEAKQMMQFVNIRMEKMYNSWTADCKLGMEDTMYVCKGYDLAELVRLAHQVGCRIVIKEMTDHDIEDPRTTREYLENHHMKLRRQRDERLNKRYS